MCLKEEEEGRGMVSQSNIGKIEREIKITVPAYAPFSLSCCICTYEAEDHLTRNSSWEIARAVRHAKGGGQQSLGGSESITYSTKPPPNGTEMKVSREIKFTLNYESHHCKDWRGCTCATVAYCNRSLLASKNKQNEGKEGSGGGWVHKLKLDYFHVCTLFDELFGSKPSCYSRHTHTHWKH